jgi:DNA-binding NtrC family response regulator
MLEALDAERTIRVTVSRRGVTKPADVEGRQERLKLRLEDGREVAIEGRLMIGCAEDNDLVLDDDYVSGWHCVVSRQGARFIVVDCGSRNGTWLGGVRVGSGELTPGVRLTVGRTAMRVVAEGPCGDAGMLGASARMRKLRERIGQVAPTRVSVMLLGESGTGKELAARALHAQSGRKGAFVVVNCGAISAELVESELFGHERGAFTGATARRPGVFEEADGGTLFLDEIGELPIGLQPKLLRALEAGTVRAVGASVERKVDVRVVAATHRDLRAAVKAKGFRLDLYHRLSAVELNVPSLRERAEDLPALANHFLDQVAPETGAKVLSSRAMEAMATYGWPGNVRELRNAIQRAAIFGGAVLEPEDLLPEAPLAVSGEGSGRIPIEGRRLDEVEREVIAVALKRAGGNRRAAAAALGVPKSTLCDRVRRYGLDLQDPEK